MNNVIVNIKALLDQHGQYPQGLKALGIVGRRDSDFRYGLYDIDGYLNDKLDVLDIGCNCGFFSYLLSRKVRSVTGIDIDPLLINVADMAIEALNVDNCTFIVQDFAKFHPINQYDLVIASQVHHWISLSFTEYADLLKGVVKDGGYLLFESHDTDTVDFDIARKVHALAVRGFSVVHSGQWVEDPGQYWVPPKKHKKIPRQFYLMRYSCANM